MQENWVDVWIFACSNIFSIDDQMKVLIILCEWNRTWKHSVNSRENEDNQALHSFRLWKWAHTFEEIVDILCVNLHRFDLLFQWVEKGVDIGVDEILVVLHQKTGWIYLFLLKKMRFSSSSHLVYCTIVVIYCSIVVAFTQSNRTDRQTLLSILIAWILAYFHTIRTIYNIDSINTVLQKKNHNKTWQKRALNDREKKYAPDKIQCFSFECKAESEANVMHIHENRLTITIFETDDSNRMT